MKKSFIIKKLKEYFGYDKFRQYQYEIIKNILRRDDTIAVLPTGFGKSLCYQLPPLLIDQLAIVISPLISLMQDQKRILNELNIECCSYNSLLSQSEKIEIKENLLKNKYKILFITPESLQSVSYLFEEINETYGISVLAIDEAHCLSSYGFDFRPKYREINQIKKFLKDVPILALTATATKEVIKDINKIMIMQNTKIIVGSFDRKNLNINVQMVNSNYIDQIKNVIETPAIIYCITRKDTELLASKLDNAIAYHAQIENKEQKQKDFMDDRYKIIVATVAFGMGINKSNIRSVIHYGSPQNIEGYYQEIGRAGRDQKSAKCYLFYRSNDFIIQKKLLNNISNNSYRVLKMNLLSVMYRYINTYSCRRKIILNYFGEEQEESNCQNCDNCLRDKQQNQTIDKNIEKKLKIILKQIYETQLNGYNYGKTTLTLILKGSGSKKITNQMKKLKLYGSLKSDKPELIKDIINKGIEYRFIKNKEIDENINVLELTNDGILFIT